MNYLSTYIAVVLTLCCVRLINGDYVPPVPRDDDPKILSRDVKCLVCRATLVEMKTAIKKINPSKKVEVSGFRMDSKASKSVQLIKSESYLTELMESVCKSMDDYAKARYKESRELTILKFTTESGGMNPEMSAVDFVQDGDLNKSLEHFCLEVLEDHEDIFLKYFMADELPKNVDELICSNTANYCDAKPIDSQKVEL